MLHGSLILRRNLDLVGGVASLDAALARKEVVRVRRGAYVDAAQWAASPPEERARTRAYAHFALQPPDRETVFCGTTAAALLGLPLFRVADDRVHVANRAARPSTSGGGVVRHVSPVADVDLTETDGLVVTGLARTVFDLIRTLSLEAAVSIADAALHRVAWRARGGYDLPAAEELRADLSMRVARAGGARGIRQARFVVEFADGRAELPGESVSRLWMHVLGVEPPVLQMEVPVPGGHAYPDFAWPCRRRFGEFDGDGKYTSPVMTRGRSLGVLLREQREREMALIAETGWTPLRWGWDRLESISRFEAFLREQRLLP